MTKFDKSTCVKVNKEKMDLVKQKGLKLQDLLDKAITQELDLDEDDMTQEYIDELKTEVEKLEKQRDESIADCQKKIDILMRNLYESKDKEEEYYNKQIDYLKAKIKYLENQLENNE
ncbi:MAG: hypothetical protein LUG89_05740 [Methanosphaera sp.]|nr:hypothetical protein [Methanosphaera sp.]